jgi:hypothetical protein
MQAIQFHLPERGKAHSSGLQAGRSRAKAFTIVEVMVAAAVMVLTITSSFSVLARSFGQLDTARCISYASQIMQSEMERSRITGWGDGTAAGNGTTGITAYPTTPATVNIVNLGYGGASDLSHDAHTHRFGRPYRYDPDHTDDQLDQFRRSSADAFLFNLLRQGRTL